ncbi:MAG: SelB C-terminal domain-containing protein [Chthonomonas sp.]|nr:SelB C-terminal domain-containing protein [Chthonomonas sp.]
MNQRQQELLARVEQAMDPYVTCSPKDLTVSLHIPPQATHQIIAIGVQEERIVRLDKDVLTLPKHLLALRKHIDSLTPRFTVADFRRASALPRSIVPAVLDWFDTQGITQREGDYRIVIG